MAVELLLKGILTLILWWPIKIQFNSLLPSKDDWIEEVFNISLHLVVLRENVLTA